MIIREHAVIRSTDSDDSDALHTLYQSEMPRFSLLDQKREPMLPTRLELQEMLSSQELNKNLFYSVENRAGEVRGFMVLRGLNQESGYCELTAMLLDEAEYDAPLAGEALEYVCDRAFTQLRMRKLLSHVLCCEAGGQRLLTGHGFEPLGAQREAVYARGRWHDIRAYARYNPSR